MHWRHKGLSEVCAVWLWNHQAFETSGNLGLPGSISGGPVLWSQWRDGIVYPMLLPGSYTVSLGASSSPHHRTIISPPNGFYQYDMVVI